MDFFTTDEINRLSQTTVRFALLVEMQFASETKYVWNGDFEFVSGGRTWAPMYGTGSIDGIGISSGSESESVTIGVSGLPDQAIDILAKALEENDEVDQQSVRIYLQFFDGGWQPVGAPLGLWWGFMQPPEVTRTAMEGTAGAVQSISITAENAFFNRSRPPAGRYTDRDQQARSPGDKFCQFTPSLLFKTFTYPSY